MRGDVAGNVAPKCLLVGLTILSIALVGGY